MLRTPLMRAIVEAESESCRWELKQDWHYTVRPDKDGEHPEVHCVIKAGYRWDGASKPWHDRAVFVLPSSHWKMVVPSLEHDDLCDRRNGYASVGINSIHAARHFRRMCARYLVDWADVVKMYWAVRLGGPRWERTDLS